MFYDKIKGIFNDFSVINEKKKNELIEKLNLSNLTEIANYINNHNLPNKIYISKDLKNSQIHYLFKEYTSVYIHELLPNNRIVIDNSFSTFYAAESLNINY